MKKRRGIKINFYKAAMKKGRVERRFPVAVSSFNSLLVEVEGGKTTCLFSNGT